jgi:hypothetical protein
LEGERLKRAHNKHLNEIHYPLCNHRFGILLVSPPSARATSAEPAAQENTLLNNAKAFVDAFEKADAKAVAALWAEDGDYVRSAVHSARQL